MIFAYADPPYQGCAIAHYKNDPSGIVPVEVDFSLLIKSLGTFDAWALSTHSPGLKNILPMCPEDVRIAAWVKSFCSFKPNVNPAYAWEPVIFRGARKRSRTVRTVRDYVEAPITLETGTHGAKPPEFCFWLFDLIGLNPDDEFVDMFPGSGAVSKAHATWKEYRFRLPKCDVADEIENRELAYMDATLHGGDGK